MSQRTSIVHLKFGRYGGAEIYTVEAAHALVAAGCEINAISTRLPRRRNAVEGILHRGLLPRTRLTRILQGGLQRYFELANEVLKRALRRDAGGSDIILVGHFHLLRAVVEYAQTTYKKVWLIVYGIDIWREWTEEEIFALQACERIIALSSYTAELVRRRLAKTTVSIVTIHPMVDKDFFNLSTELPPDEPRIILTVSRLDAAEAYKGHDFIIQSLPILKRRLGTPLEYHILGDGNDRSRLEKLSSDCGVSQDVRFLGEIWGNQRIDIYQRCHIFAMPSYVSKRPDGSWTGEGFGIVYIEAAACGKPVLACDVGGQVDCIRHGETGILVKPTVEAVESGLLEILSDLENARQMGMAGRDFVLKNFTREHFNNKWAELLGQI